MLSISQAAEYIESSAKSISALWAALILIFGVLIGSGIGYLAATKVAKSERTSTEQITQNIFKSCVKNKN